MRQQIGQFPHCDQRILHAPGECKYCDSHPLWQELRAAWGIAFTGHSAPLGTLPCPADYDRPPGSTGDHRRWAGNRARPEGYDDVIHTDLIRPAGRRGHGWLSIRWFATP